MITVEHVTKRYGGFTALDDVSFTAKPGRVTGFLGPNGAGKSTTMRVMVGLTRPAAGHVTIDGRAYADLPNPGVEVGVLLDASAQHGGRKGKEVLSLTAMTMGLQQERADQMMSLVGLTHAEGKRRVRHYSLGMRQRLGIAQALMGEPKVLILDEPANGLDPAGIHWMRELLRRFAADGGTVLLSSHLLHEVEQLADDIILIGGGRIVSQTSKQALLHSAGSFVRSSDDAALEKALSGAGHPVTRAEDGGLRCPADPAEIGRLARDGMIALVELRAAESAGLEELFLQMTGDTQRDPSLGAQPGAGWGTA